MFKSVVWSSTIDYPNQVSTVLFVGTCNWNCEFCYNRNLINNESIDFNTEILPRLISRKNFINHIIISGGECTCYTDLENIINILKSEGFIVGIHTNGSNPLMIEKLISQINFIGMDIKTGTCSNYKNVTNCNIKFFDIINSAQIILSSNIQYEFRTTLYPRYVDMSDCIIIAKFLIGLKANEYILQQYDNSFDNNSVIPYSIKYIKEIQQECNKFIPTIIKGW